MANQFLDAKEYANAMLLLLKNQLVLGRNVSTTYTNQVTDQNGLSISVKRPPQFIAKDGAALAKQDIVTGSEVISVDQYKNVHVGIGDLEHIQSFNELMRSETMKSAASTLAHSLDSYLHEQLLRIPSWVGDPGETISSPGEFMKSHTRLMNQSVPNSDLRAVLSFEDGENIRASLLAGNIDNVNRSALERARIPMMSEIDAFATQNLKYLTTGDRGGTILVDGANQNVNYRDVKDSAYLQQELVLDGFTGSTTIKKGEVFTIAGVYAINRRTNETLDYLQQFTVIEDVTASGAGAATVKITPAIIVPGTNDGTSTDANTAFATVSAAPADNAAVTVLGSASTSYPVRAAFHKSAIQIVSARLHTPHTGVASFARDEGDTNVMVRYWRGSDISTGEHIHRWDMVFGAKMMDNRLATRISGQT